MFLVILLVVVILFIMVKDISSKDISFKEGMDAESKSGEIYTNYNRIGQSLEEYKAKFNSLVM